MTGDGLADIVQISAARVTYWSNTGHGTFGPPVEMGNPPNLNSGFGFDAERVRLMEVDGSGTTDMLYLVPSGCAVLFYKQAGNSWSCGVRILMVPTIDPSSVFALDLLGSGTACLCWVDRSNASDMAQIRFINLIGSNKPHLLRRYSNGQGMETTVSYKASTEFYLRDQADGNPWTTKLPFPVQCLAEIATLDNVRGHATRTCYTYHNGYYDPLGR